MGRTRRLGSWTLAAGALGAALVAACAAAGGGSKDRPVDLVSPREAEPTATQQATARPEGPVELVWGGWHHVPFEAALGGILWEAREHDRARSYEDALEVIERGLAQGGPSATLLECRGALHATLGFWRAAEQDFVLATRARPERAAAWEALAQVREELGLHHAAARARAEAERRRVPELAEAR